MRFTPLLCTFSAKSTKSIQGAKTAMYHVHRKNCFHPAQTVRPLKIHIFTSCFTGTRTTKIFLKFIFMKADLHFHTTLSDGRDRPEQVLANLVSSGVRLATLTDSSTSSVNDFADELRARGIETTPASEISTHFFAGLSKVGLHMTAYAPAFHKHMLCSSVLEQEKLRKFVSKLERLIGQWYPLSHEWLAQWAIAKWYNPAGLNNAHLSSYVYSTPGAIELANTWTNKEKNHSLTESDFWTNVSNVKDEIP